mgnify:CR=1 FL=1|jgi:hypothetical protein|tara:strand:+ start:4146 stop:4361 length:216 start_codon:yes stop_codon:yes gene_type:complete
MLIENKPEEKSITFTWRERFIILTKGKLIFAPENFKHFCNNLFRILFEFQKETDPKLKDLTTNIDDDIETK